MIFLVLCKSSRFYKHQAIRSTVALDITLVIQVAKQKEENF